MSKIDEPSHPLLQLLSPPDRTLFQRQARAVRFRPDRPLLRAGAARTPVFFLHAGYVRVFHRNRAGGELMVRLLRAPAVLGDVEALLGLPVLESADSLSVCEGWTLPRRAFQLLWDRSPELARTLGQDLATRLLSLSEQHRAAGLASVTSRLADLLVNYADLQRARSENTSRIGIRVGQASLSRDLGVGRTALTQALDQLKDQRLVRKQNARYEVPNIEALRARGTRVMGACHSLRPVSKNVSRMNSGETLRVRLPIPTVEAGQAPFYIAQLKGFYARQGLRVTFSLSEAGSDPITAVANGQAWLGVVGGPEMILAARARGLPVKAVGQMHHDSNFACLLTLRSSRILRVQQLRKKRVGFFYGHVSTHVIRTWMRASSIPYEEVDVGYDYSPLIAGQVDAQWAFRPTAGLELPAMGVQVNTLLPSDSGYSTDGYTLFVRDDTAEEAEDAVRRFVRATGEGMREVKADLAAANQVLLEQAPLINADLNLQRLRLYNAAMVPDPMEALGEARLRRTYDLMWSAGLVERAFDVREAMLGSR